MIILLTGKPGIGKSTVIEKLIKLNKEPSYWVVTSGIPRPELGDRGGFAATNSDGVRRVISHKTDIDSDIIVGENHVDLEAVDAMFAEALEEATKPEGLLTIIDEIGPIQLLSPAFTAALEHAFSGEADMIATIHYDDERLDKFRNSEHAVLLQVTKDNRDYLPSILAALAIQRRNINYLNPAQQSAFFALLRRYLENDKLLQIHKLTDNSLSYVLYEQVNQIDKEDWEVTGNHGQYHVSLNDVTYGCTCDLFNGKGEYAGQAGECSHIQAVQIATA